MEPTAGLNAGVSLFLVFPVSQHDVVTSKANLASGIDGYYTALVIHDFSLEREMQIMITTGQDLIEDTRRMYSRLDFPCSLRSGLRSFPKQRLVIEPI